MDYDTEVRLLAYTEVADDTLYDQCSQINLDTTIGLIEFAGRLCYDAQEKLGQTPDWIQKRIREGHESLIEHASATFHITASRVLTHELVTYRIASYSQRSQQYVKETEPQYITPPELAKVRVPDKDSDHPLAGSMEGGHFYRMVMERAWQAYKQLLAAGVKPEIARYVLPNACETQIVMTMNFRELRHFIKLRASPLALPEMQEVANKIRAICQERWPAVFGDL